jgi:hypothetical protein
LVEVYHAVLQKIIQTTWGCYQAVWTLLDCPLLVTFGSSTIGTRGRDLHRFAKLLCVTEDLVAELARRCHYKERRALLCVDLSLFLEFPEFDETWQQEGKCLA